MLKSQYKNLGGVSSGAIGWFRLDHMDGGYLHNKLSAEPKPE